MEAGSSAGISPIPSFRSKLGIEPITAKPSASRPCPLSVTEKVVSVLYVITARRQAHDSVQTKRSMRIEDIEYLDWDQKGHKWFPVGFDVQIRETSLVRRFTHAGCATWPDVPPAHPLALRGGSSIR